MEGHSRRPMNARALSSVSSCHQSPHATCVQLGALLRRASWSSLGAAGRVGRRLEWCRSLSGGSETTLSISAIGLCVSANWIARRGSHPAPLARQQKGRGDNAEQRHVGVQPGGGFCGCHARGGLPRHARHRFRPVSGAADPGRPARPATARDDVGRYLRSGEARWTCCCASLDLWSGS